jgi:tetratricopeptide (TPR) repeat protein
MQNADAPSSPSLADPHAHLQAGEASARADDWPRALAHFRVAVAAAPAMPEAWVNLSTALQRMGRLDDAERTAREALALKPDFAAALNLLGLVEIDRRRFDAALAHLERALQLQPDFAVARMNLGIAQHGAGRDDDALASLGHALELDRSLATAHYNLGALHHQRGRHAEAERHYREAIALRPAYAQAHFNLALALFITGRLDEAWREYAHRVQKRQSAPVLTHEDRERIAVHDEQGLGDSLFFLRFAPALRARGRTLEFVGDERLHAMLARTGLFAASARRLEELPPADRDVVLAGDLPLLAPGAATATPAPLALSADPATLAAVRERLAALGPAPYIALAWRAGEPRSGRIENLFKGIPLETLGAALRGTKATWIAVQRDPARGEIETLSKAIGATVHDGSAVNADLEEALATLAAVDDYVGVSSSLVHLRAGAGGPAHVVVPFPYEWRWMESGDRSPWFPQAAVYRQEAGGAWDNAMARLAADLKARFG